MVLFQVGRSLVAPNSNFSTKYYNTILFQICLAHKLSLTKFKPGIVIYRQINIQTLLLHINKSLVNSEFWSAPQKFLIKFKPYCWISTNQHSNPTFYISKSATNQQISSSKFQPLVLNSLGKLPPTYISTLEILDCVDLILFPTSKETCIMN
jgi:hypothetical protein